MDLNKEIKQFCENHLKTFDQIDAKRKASLMQLSTYFSQAYQNKSIPNAISICTHNSRRSHFAQIWLAVAASFFNRDVKTFSGGTEVTEVNINVLNCLLNLGFKVVMGEEEENPKIQISWSDEIEPYIAFSKVYDDSINPKKDFAAIMVCTSADENCPVVLGADAKISLPFDDPKAFDDSEKKEEMYQLCCETIAREMLFVMYNVSDLVV